MTSHAQCAFAVDDRRSWLRRPPAPTASSSRRRRAAGTVAEGVRAVLVDVVVRDKRGQPVRDLAQSDFEIIEDGVPQKIGSFTPFFESAPAAPARARAGAARTARSRLPRRQAAAAAPTPVLWSRRSSSIG